MIAQKWPRQCSGQRPPCGLIGRLVLSFDLPALSSLILLLTLAAPSLPTPSTPSTEMRGLWVVRTALTSPQSIDQVVDDASRAGFNALFVQVRGRGDALYDSRLVARSPLLWQQPASFDPFARLLERARLRGLQVHAWINVLLTAHFGQPLPGGHVIREHPQWVMVPRPVATAALTATPDRLLRLVAQASRSGGDSEGYYLSPSVPGVGEHLEKVVRELLHEYPVQGLHLDFIRYPGPEFDYSRAALEGFRRLRGGTDLLGGPGHAAAAWDEYRRDVLSALAARLVGAARAERPGAIVSAAVVPDEVTAVSQRYQSWPSWLADGLLDAVCPMTYTQDSHIFRQQVAQARTRVKAGQSLWAGIGAYRLTVDGTIEKIQAARESGANGVVVFSHESLAGGDWRRMRDLAFSGLQPAVSVRSRELTGGQ
jgi:uncharacterized lipoprotein YddW (UPF0748 family)